MTKPKVCIVEIDGDRGSPPGGFKIHIRAGGQTSTSNFNWYSTEAERKALLSSTRRKAQKIADDLGTKVEEQLF